MVRLSLTIFPALSRLMDRTETVRLGGIHGARGNPPGQDLARLLDGLERLTLDPGASEAANVRSGEHVRTRGQRERGHLVRAPPDGARGSGDPAPTGGPPPR